MAEEIKWITVKGVHIPIMPGQTKKQAVESFVQALKESEDNKRKSTKRLVEELTISSESQTPKDERKKVGNKTRTISREHYSRLCVMWSDYARGACRPVEKDGIKYFDIDNSVYAVSGEYPEFKIVAVRQFRNAIVLTKYLKELNNEN